MVGECNEKTFLQAKQNILERFSLVAPTEEVEVLMSILGQNFNVNNVAYAKGQISGMKIASQDNSTLCELIAERNKYDVDLYNYVKELWQEWKSNNIESILENKNAQAEYLVLSPEFYQTKVPKIMNLDQIENYGIDKPELVALNQNMGRLVINGNDRLDTNISNDEL